MHIDRNIHLIKNKRRLEEKRQPFMKVIEITRKIKQDQELKVVVREGIQTSTHVVNNYNCFVLYFGFFFWITM